MYTLATSGQYCHYLQFSHQSRHSHLHAGVIFCPPLVKESHVHILVVAPPAHIHKHMKCQHLLYIRRQTQYSVNHKERTPICQQSQAIMCMRLWLRFVLQQHQGMRPASMPNRRKIKNAGKLINPHTLAFPLFFPPHPLYCQQDTHMYINTTTSNVRSHLLLPQTNRARLHIDPTYDDVSTSHIPRSRDLRSPRAPSPARAPSPRTRESCEMSISPTQGQFIDPMQMSILKQMLQQMQEYLQPECMKVPFKPSSNTHLQPESGKVYVASNMHFVFIYMMQYGMNIVHIHNNGNVQTSTQKIP